MRQHIASLRTLVAARVAKLSLSCFMRGLRKKAPSRTAEVTHLFRSLRHKLDPLDREILERAFDAKLAAVKGDDSTLDFDSGEGLEAILRRELIEIACFSGVSDHETLRDLLLARLPPVRRAPTAG
jgi:hypothetical protein